MRIVENGFIIWFSFLGLALFPVFIRLINWHLSLLSCIVIVVATLVCHVIFWQPIFLSLLIDLHENLFCCSSYESTIDRVMLTILVTTPVCEDAAELNTCTVIVDSNLCNLTVSLEQCCRSCRDGLTTTTHTITTTTAMAPVFQLFLVYKNHIHLINYTWIASRNLE